VEKQKFVYILNRDANARLTISSPLEAHKTHTLLYSVCGVDVGFENPIFACLELDYEDLQDGVAQKVDRHSNFESLTIVSFLFFSFFLQRITFYELDLGLNHVMRKWTDPVDPSSNLIIKGNAVEFIDLYAATTHKSFFFFFLICSAGRSGWSRRCFGLF
jgi:splicing factor 3B subunit 3